MFQRDDSAGGLLRSVQIPRSSPVVACLEQYWRMLRSPAEEMRALTSDALFSASACCLDKRFTGKLRSLVGSPEDLKAADAVLDAVRVWSWRKRF